MHPKDESKAAFMTEIVSYCYKVMPFGLKNIVDWILSPMLGRNVQAYVDDMVITSGGKTSMSLSWMSYLPRQQGTI